MVLLFGGEAATAIPSFARGTKGASPFAKNLDFSKVREAKRTLPNKAPEMHLETTKVHKKLDAAALKKQRERKLDETEYSVQPCEDSSAFMPNATLEAWCTLSWLDGLTEDSCNSKNCSSASSCSGPGSGGGHSWIIDAASCTDAGCDSGGWCSDIYDGVYDQTNCEAMNSTWTSTCTCNDQTSCEAFNSTWSMDSCSCPDQTSCEAVFGANSWAIYLCGGDGGNELQNDYFYHGQSAVANGALSTCGSTGGADADQVQEWGSMCCSDGRSVCYTQTSEYELCGPSIEATGYCVMPCENASMFLPDAVYDTSCSTPWPFDDAAQASCDEFCYLSGYCDGDGMDASMYGDDQAGCESAGFNFNYNCNCADQTECEGAGFVWNVATCSDGSKTGVYGLQSQDSWMVNTMVDSITTCEDADSVQNAGALCCSDGRSTCYTQTEEYALCGEAEYCIMPCADESAFLPDAVYRYDCENTWQIADADCEPAGCSLETGEGWSSCGCEDQASCEEAGATWTARTCGGEIQTWTWLLENNDGDLATCQDPGEIQEIGVACCSDQTSVCGAYVPDCWLGCVGDSSDVNCYAVVSDPSCMDG